MDSRKEKENRQYFINSVNVQIEDNDLMISGWEKIADFLTGEIVKKEQDSTCAVGIDGYYGTNWELVKRQLEISLKKAEVDTVFFNIEECLLEEDVLKEMLAPYLGDEDPVFGKIYHGRLKDFYDLTKLKRIRDEVSELKKRSASHKKTAVICYGTGTLLSVLNSQYDIKLYCDLTREKALVCNNKWSQLSGKSQTIGPKKLYYVDMPTNDRHRNGLLKKIDFYIDANNDEIPTLLSTQNLQRITTALASMPFRLKYLYEPGPWGGQWLKKIRHLHQDWVNCAWSYEVIATEMSALVGVEDMIIELPWTTFLYLQYDRIMGDVPRRRFQGQFPIRFDYLDTMDGDDLSIQVHPGTKYIHDKFGEPYHQGEMYYIVDAKEGSSVNLGLNENTNMREFKAAAVRAEQQGIKFNYSDYVNKVPVKKHDILMIPPGTVHGSGKGLVVLEVSATTYRYTFKIYDHLRPDLDGVMRPIHIEHAFNVIRPFRRTKWVKENLIQEPQLVREGQSWKEFVIADRREFFHVVYRLEFEKRAEDDTAGSFHILTLVAGESVIIQSLVDADTCIPMRYSETVIIPACLGAYEIVNQAEGACKVVKSRLR